MDQSQAKPLIVAHRGASAVAPENTLAALARALELESDGVEFDVRITRDGVPVVFHDADLRRIAGSTERIVDLQSRELEAVDVGRWFDEASFAGEGIPSLESALEILGSYSGVVYVEMKTSVYREDELAGAVAELLSAYVGPAKLIVKSFDFQATQHFRRLCPQIETAALFEPTIMRILRMKKGLIDIARRIGSKRLSVHSSLASDGFVRLAGEAGFPVAVWTVDDIAWIEQARERGIDSLITNDPGKLLAARDERS